MKNLAPWLVLMVVLVLNSYLTAYFMKPEPVVFEPYNDSAIKAEFASMKDQMKYEMTLLHSQVDSINLALASTSKKLENKVRTINELKKQLDEIQDSIDYSTFNNAQLHNAITGFIDKNRSRKGPH